MRIHKQTAVALCVCTALAGSASAAVKDQPVEESPFAMQKLASGYMVVDSDDGKEGEGSCGEGSCGADDHKDDSEGSCGADSKDDTEGSCGEGSCGADNKDDAEGECGEGSCGGQI